MLSTFFLQGQRQIPMWHTIRGINFLVSHPGWGKQSLETLLSSSAFKTLKKELQICDQRNKTDVRLPSTDAKQPPGCLLGWWNEDISYKDKNPNSVSGRQFWVSFLPQRFSNADPLAGQTGISWNLLGALCGSQPSMFEDALVKVRELKCRGYHYPQRSGLWRKGWGSQTKKTPWN